MREILEVYSHISAVIVTLEIIVMGAVAWKAWKWEEKDGK
jgi:hypothetical protein